MRGCRVAGNFRNAPDLWSISARDQRKTISRPAAPLLSLFVDFLQLSHGVGIVLLLVLWWFAAGLSPLWLSVATTVIMIVVAVWESLSLGSQVEEA